MKRSKLLMILSALLCIVMLFSSCSFVQNEDENDDTNKTPEPEETPKTQLHFTAPETNIDLEAVINSVTKYLSYKEYSNGDEIEAKFPTTIERLFGNGNDITEETYGALKHYVERVETERTVEIDPEEEGMEPEEVIVIDVTLTHYVYNTKTSTVVYKSESVTTQQYTDAEVIYNVNIHLGGLFVVTETNKVVIPEEIDPETEEVITPETYEYVATYKVYNVNGDVVAEPEVLDLETHTLVGYSAVSIDDKTYCVVDGEVVKVFERGHNYDIPIDPDYVIGDYRYYENSNGVQVVDKDDKIVVEYVCNEYEYCILLENGNILVIKTELLPEDAEKYDVEIYGIKCTMSYSVIDVATGTKGEVKFASGFVPVTFVNSFGAFGMDARKYANTAVVSGKVYAVGYKAGANQLVGAVLNEDLTVAATFENPAVNANSDVAFVNQTEFVVSGRIADQIVKYSVRIFDKSIHIADNSVVAADYVLNDYIIIGGIIYDSTTLNQVYDIYNSGYSIGWYGLIYNNDDVYVNAAYNVVYVQRYNEETGKNEYGVLYKNSYSGISYSTIISDSIEYHIYDFENTTKNGFFIITSYREDYDYYLNRHVNIVNLKGEYIYSFNTANYDELTVNGNLLKYEVTKQYEDEDGYHSDLNTYYFIIK